MVEQSKALQMGPIGCPESLVTNSQPTLRNFPQLQRCGSLKPRKSCINSTNALVHILILGSNEFFIKSSLCPLETSRHYVTFSLSQPWKSLSQIMRRPELSPPWSTFYFITMSLTSLGSWDAGRPDLRNRSIVGMSRRSTTELHIFVYEQTEDWLVGNWRGCYQTWSNRAVYGEYTGVTGGTDQTSGGCSLC